jgi:hypothetical protein
MDPADYRSQDAPGATVDEVGVTAVEGGNYRPRTSHDRAERSTGGERFMDVDDIGVLGS